MNDPTIYGQKLDRETREAIFGETGGKGINVVDGVVKYIYVTCGVSSRFPNVVTTDKILYCYSKIPADACAMKKSYEGGLSFPVKVAPNGGTDTFFWGMGKITALNDPTAPAGKSRYVVDKTSSEMPALPPAKKRRVGSIEVNDAGEQYDSLLEYRHACVMKELGIPFVRPAPILPSVDICENGVMRTVTYNPDFYLLTEPPAFVEIKPAFPYDVAQERCISACRKYRLDFILLYNSEFRISSCGQAEVPPGSYEHTSGIRGILYAWNRSTQEVDVSHDVAYMAEDDERGEVSAFLAKRNGPRDARVYHPKVREAFSKVESIQL
jgi:hypothetical protein